MNLILIRIGRQKHCRKKAWECWRCGGKEKKREKIAFEIWTWEEGNGEEGESKKKKMKYQLKGFLKWRTICEGA